MKQTAVEFLIKEFSDILGLLDTKPMQDLLMMDAMKKAKAMEKEHKIDFANWCRIHDNKYPNEVWTIQQLFDKYIKETYGGNK
jgi:hypothetical protein